MNKLVESKFSEEIKENSKSESDALWFDDGMDEVLKQIQIPQESTPAKMHQVIVKKHHYTIPEILDIIDQIDDDEVIQSSQPMVLGRSGNRSAFKKNGYGDQESLFCDSESDIFRTNSATSSIMTSHNVQSSIIDNDEISNSSNKTVDYDYDLAGSSKENSENAPKEVTPTSCSILSKETKSPSIFNRNLNYSKLTEYSQSSHVLKPHNHNLFNDLVISPVSSKTQRSANNFENYKLIKPVATLSGEVLQSSQSPMCVRIARSSRAQIVSSDEDEIFATCKSVRILIRIYFQAYSIFRNFSDTIFIIT